jgi:hypothetical protein
MRDRNVWILVLALLAAACKPTAPAGEAAPAAPAAAAPATAPVAAPVAPAAPALESAFTVDMAYADLRKRLTDAGWLPLRDPMCRENVGGEARVCGELPEVESCSGDGHCVMHFANADQGKRMRVTTYGPSERWNVPGEEAAFAVKSWDVSALEPVAKSIEGAAPACPSRDFDAFLKTFASDPRIERAFTAPLVKVAELYSGDAGDQTRMVYVAGGAYDDFNVDHVDNAYRFVDSEGKVDTTPLKLDIASEGDRVRAVSYRYGMSEGNSYRFEDRGDCWYLAQDPDAPSP